MRERLKEGRTEFYFFITRDVEFVRVCFNQKIGAGKSDSGRPNERQYAGICGRTSGRVQEDAHIHFEPPHVRNLARCAGLRRSPPGDAGQVFRRYGIALLPRVLVQGRNVAVMRLRDKCHSATVYHVRLDRSGIYFVDFDRIKILAVEAFARHTNGVTLSVKVAGVVHRFFVHVPQRLAGDQGRVQELVFAGGKRQFRHQAGSPLVGRYFGIAGTECPCGRSHGGSVGVRSTEGFEFETHCSATYWRESGRTAKGRAICC